MKKKEKIYFRTTLMIWSVEIGNLKKINGWSKFVRSEGFSKIVKKSQSAQHGHRCNPFLETTRFLLYLVTLID